MINIYEVIVGNVGCVDSTHSKHEALAQFRDWIAESKKDIGRAAGEPVTLMMNSEVIKEYEQDAGFFYVEVTDTFGGEANYCWANRYKVQANTMRGAISKVSKESNYAFRKGCDTGDMTRYDAVHACVCAFVESYSTENHSQNMHVKTI